MANQKRQPRAFFYSPDCPKGRIFTGADAIADAKKDGWVDTPAKLTRKKNGGTQKVTAGDNS